MRYDDALREVESFWSTLLPSVIERHVALHADEQIYAAAFWLFYLDFRVIYAPAFAFNAESAVRQKGDERCSWSTRWVPAEWKWSVVNEVAEASKAIYSTLSEAMTGATDAEWKALEVAHDRVIARVARRLNETAGEGFVVVALEDRDGEGRYEELIRWSVSEDRLATLKGILDP